MELIKPSVEIWEQGSTLEDMWKHIARCTRVCYQSTPKNDGETDEEFVKRVILRISNGDLDWDKIHGAMLEHGTVYLTIPDREPDEFGRMDYSSVSVGNYSTNEYSRVTYRNYYQEPNETQKDYCSKIPRTTTYVTTNLRVLMDNDWMDDLQYLCEPTE